MVIDNDGGSQGMREQMRWTMSRRYDYNDGYRHPDGKTYEDGYRDGYKHGWDDAEDENNGNYRRERDSRGRYM